MSRRRRLSSSSDDVVCTGETKVTVGITLDLTDDPIENPPPPKKPRPYSSIARMFQQHEQREKKASPAVQVPIEAPLRRTEVETIDQEYTSKRPGEKVSIRTRITREISDAPGECSAGGPSLRLEGEPSGLGGGSSGRARGESSKKSDSSRERAFKRSGPQTFMVDLTEKYWNESLKGFSSEEIDTIKRDVQNFFSGLKNHETYKDLLKCALKNDLTVEECEDTSRGMGLFANSDIRARSIVTVPSGGTFYPVELEPDALENGEAMHTFTCHVYGKVGGKEYRLNGTLHAKNAEIYRVNHGCPRCEANSNFTQKLIRTSNVSLWLLCVQTMEPIETEGGKKEILVSYNYDQTQHDLEALYKEMPWAKCDKCHGAAGGSRRKR